MNELTCVMCAAEQFTLLYADSSVLCLSAVPLCVDELNQNFDINLFLIFLGDFSRSSVLPMGRFASYAVKITQFEKRVTRSLVNTLQTVTCMPSKFALQNLEVHLPNPLKSTEQQ